MDAGQAYRTLGPAVLAYLRGQNVADPDDLLGEVFFQVARSMHQFEGDEQDLRRWVFTIARNRVIDARRSAARRLRTVELTTHDRAEADADLEGVDDELIAALRRLTDDQREVIALRFIADLSLEDVAQMTGRTVGATKSMQHRALEQLAKQLDDERGGRDGDA